MGQYSAAAGGARTRRTVLIIVGSVGAGKTKVCRLLTRRGFAHVDIADIYRSDRGALANVPNWRQLALMRRSWRKAAHAIRKSLRSSPVAFESTGINHPWWSDLVENLSRVSGVQVRTVLVCAPFKVVWRRLRSRKLRYGASVTHSYRQALVIWRSAQNLVQSVDFVVRSECRGGMASQVDRILRRLSEANIQPQGDRGDAR